MKESIYSKVIVYHDETKKIEKTNLQAHILLLIPIQLTIKRSGTLFGDEENSYQPLKAIYGKIMEIRKKYNAFHKFHFNRIPKSGKWTQYNQAERKLIEVGVEALKTKRSSAFSFPLFCKMAIIFYPMVPLDQYSGERKEKRLRYHETLFRMLLKGAVHYLYDDRHPVEVSKIISDGMPYHRELSEERILWRLIIDDFLGKSPLREYVNISPKCEIIHQSSQHTKFSQDSEEYIHANMLQLADMLLGSVIYSCYRGIKVPLPHPSINKRIEDKKGTIVLPVKEMLDKRKRGRNFVHSSHYKSFSLSVAYIENGNWTFENVITKEIEIIPDAEQLTLSDLLGDV